MQIPMVSGASSEGLHCGKASSPTSLTQCQLTLGQTPSVLHLLFRLIFLIFPLFLLSFTKYGPWFFWRLEGTHPIFYCCS